jgi:hypothetical protein
MATKAQVQHEEREMRQEARATAHRTGNYRLDPFKDSETVTQRPTNCYGCSWEIQPDKTYRLKFRHKLCYPGHEQTS